VLEQRDERRMVSKLGCTVRNRNNDVFGLEFISHLLVNG